MIDNRVKSGDRLTISADTWNKVLQATEAFFGGGGNRSAPGSGRAGAVEILQITASATGGGNYTAKQLLSITGEWPKACSDPDDIGTWTESASCYFVNVPELFAADSHMLTDAAEDAIGIGVSLSIGSDGKPVFFGVGFLVAECEE